MARVCSLCRALKDDKEFYKQKRGAGSGYYYCKECFRDRNKILNAASRAKKNPKKYSMCNDCDRIFCNTSDKRCRFCKSNNIESI